MAGNVQISIKDDQSAKQWLSMVQAINDDYYKAMQEASETLTSMQDFADGTLVDDFYEFGTNLLNAAEATSNAINEIADTVTNILGKVQNFLGEATGIIGSAVGKILGR
ncbi:MAG: hypothetical protein IJP27_10185 [Clostridia bacterium]|nr:hypothetical protein [Clostridia bacterium]